METDYKQVLTKNKMRTREKIHDIITHTGGFTKDSENQLFRELILEVLLDIRELLTHIVKKIETHEHNYISKQYVGTWSANIPPPTMFCVKCGSWA
jgi:hypothetical protein